jgi:hypothetical protein
MSHKIAKFPSITLLLLLLMKSMKQFEKTNTFFHVFFFFRLNLNPNFIVFQPLTHFASLSFQIQKKKKRKFRTRNRNEFDGGKQSLKWLNKMWQSL